MKNQVIVLCERNEQLREAQINWIKFLLNKNTLTYIVRVKEI